MLDEHKDLVAGDFNGAAWRCSKRNNMLIPLKKPLLTALCQRSLVPPPCGDQVRFQAAGLMCAGFSSRTNPIGIGKFDSTMPFPFLMKLQPAPDRSKLPPSNMASPRQRRVARRSATTWKVQSRDPLKRTSCAVPWRQTERHISDIMSDHSLSSWLCGHSRAFIKNHVERVHPHQWFDGASLSIP